MRFSFSFFLIICSYVNVGFGQNIKLHNKADMKGKFYFYYGWNRATYTKSDIHFHGSNFDFTVKNTVAKDRQSPFGVDPYFTPDQITIPQYNYRFGYFFNSKYNLSFGFDHMKYVLVQDQIAKVTGSIEGTSTKYDRTYDNENVELSGDFLQFEHTDGLNYLNLELNRTDNIVRYKKIALNGIYGIGSGVMYPRTRAIVLSREVNDQWHVSGFGISAKAGLNISFYNHFFIQGELKGGFIDMMDIVIESHSSDRAKQHFGFLQANIVFGYQFNLINY